MEGSLLDKGVCVSVDVLKQSLNCQTGGVIYLDGDNTYKCKPCTDLGFSNCNECDFKFRDGKP
jgi:hypothetical protein